MPGSTVLRLNSFHKFVIPTGAKQSGGKFGEVHHVTASALTRKHGERPQVSPNWTDHIAVKDRKILLPEIPENVSTLSDLLRTSLTSLRTAVLAEQLR
jgi:hypothetical protein